MNDRLIPEEQPPRPNKPFSKITVLVKRMPIAARRAAEIGAAVVCLAIVALILYPSLKGGHKLANAAVSDTSAVSQTAQSSTVGLVQTTMPTANGTVTSTQQSSEVTGNTISTTQSSQKAEAKPTVYTGPVTTDYDFMLFNASIYRASKDGKFNKLIDGNYQTVYDDPVAGKVPQSGVNIQQVIPDGEWLYYVRYEPMLHTKTLNGIFRCRADGSDNQQVIQGLFPSPVYIIGDQLVYLGFPNNDFFKDKFIGLYTIKKDGSNRKQIASFSLSSNICYNRLTVSDDYAYLLYNNSLIRVSLSTGNNSTVLKWSTDETKPHFNYKDNFVVNSGWIYYFETSTQYDSQNNSISSIKLKRIRTIGTGDTTLVSSLSQTGSLAVYNDRIYFINAYTPENYNSSENGIFSIPLNSSSSSESLKNVNGGIGNFTILNNNIYVQYCISLKTERVGIFRIDLKTYQKTNLY